MSAVQFTVAGPVVGKGRPRATTISGHARLYTPEKTRSYENRVAHEAQLAMGGREPFEGPLALNVEVFCAVPTSWSGVKQRRALFGLIMPTVKPDTSNIVKCIEDAMNLIVYHDDAQIVDVHVTKRYHRVPCAVVRVTSAPAPTPAETKELQCHSRSITAA